MRSLAISLVFISLSACGGVAEQENVPQQNGNLPGAGGAADAPEGSLGGEEQCDAADYRPLIGTPYTDAIFPSGPKLRVYSTADLVTQDYLPDRTNVVFNEETSLIIRAFCG